MKIDNCKLKTVCNGILDILFPKICVGCGREGTYICKSCEIFLSEIEPILGYPISNHIFGKSDILNIVSVWEYEGLMEKLIQKIKYDGCYDIIGELIEKAFEKIDLKLPEDTVITFVPMWKRKEKRRGFNQAEIIAQKLSQLLRLAEQPLLEKIKDNRSQVGLNPQERIENVKGVFKLKGVGLPLMRKVLVVDDVYTTGATMNECIKILKGVGVKNVWGFTLSRKMSIQNY